MTKQMLMAGTFAACLMGVSVPTLAETSAAAAMTSPVGLTPGDGQMDETSRADIEALIEQEDDAWNRGDATAYSAAVLDDCVFTNIFGQVFVGREAFERQHAAIFATIYRGSNLHQSIGHLRFVRPDVAIVDTEIVLEVSAGPAGPARTLETRLVQTLVKGPDGWGVASYHNVEVRSPPGPPAA